MDKEEFKRIYEKTKRVGVESDKSGIHSIHIDFDKNILEINGEPVKKQTIVSLPDFDNWQRRKIFNFDESVPTGESDSIDIYFTDYQKK